MFKNVIMVCKPPMSFGLNLNDNNSHKIFKYALKQINDQKMLKIALKMEKQ